MAEKITERFAHAITVAPALAIVAEAGDDSIKASDAREWLRAVSPGLLRAFHTVADFARRDPTTEAAQRKKLAALLHASGDDLEAFRTRVARLQGFEALQAACAAFLAWAGVPHGGRLHREAVRGGSEARKHVAALLAASPWIALTAHATADGTPLGVTHDDARALLSKAGPRTRHGLEILREAATEVPEIDAEARAGLASGSPSFGHLQAAARQHVDEMSGGSLHELAAADPGLGELAQYGGSFFGNLWHTLKKAPGTVLHAGEGFVKGAANVVSSAQAGVAAILAHPIESAQAAASLAGNVAPLLAL